MTARAFVLLLMTLLVATSPAAQLPAVSWTCPMHPDVLEPKKGTCGICGMDLEAIRLVLLYTCPVHAVIEQSKPGTCRICSRELVQKTAALTFTCAGQRNISQLEPGTCADGSAMVPRYTPRAHGDHNPKHGGLFFMAPDNWHHLEGTYPAAGRFRVYVYDDFSKPLNISEARKIRGRVVTKEAFDAKTGTTRELASAPLVLAPNGAFFEARIESLSLPAKMTAKLSFSPDVKESRFDFAFSAYSRDVPAAPRAPSISTAAPSTSSNDPQPAPAQAEPSSGGSLAALKSQRDEVETFIKAGTFGAIYVPALQAKDTALQIQAQNARAAGIDQDAVEASVKQIVLSAYQLDNFGDLGDGEKIQDAYRRFSAAIAQLDSLLATRQ